MEKENGLFIVLEGGEGSGKSTIVSFLKELFEKRGHEVVAIREPGGTEFAEKVRDIYLNTSGLSGLSVGLLMNAARQDNIEKNILPALNEGKVVISDRFSGSSLVYQGLRKGEYEAVEAITRHIPMISVFSDVPPEIGLERIHSNHREVNRLDLMPLEQHQKIYNGFKELSVLKPDIYWDIVIDGTLTIDELYELFDRGYVPLMSELIKDGLNTYEIKEILRGQTVMAL